MRVYAGSVKKEESISVSPAIKLSAIYMSYCNRMCNSSSSALSDRWVPTDQEYKESQQALASCVPKRQLHDSCNVEIFGDMTVSFEACTKPSIYVQKKTADSCKCGNLPKDDCFF